MSWPNYDGVIKLKHFPPYWPLVRGIHQSAVNSPHKGQRHGALIFFYLRLNKRFSKQSRRRWFDTPLWRLCHDYINTRASNCTLDRSGAKAIVGVRKLHIGYLTIISQAKCPTLDNFSLKDSNCYEHANYIIQHSERHVFGIRHLTHKS